MCPDEDLLTIGELAERTGRTTHTLRYYEEEGLIPDVRRTEAGHRRYRPEHVQWMVLLDRLRRSGMPIETMRRYTDLVEGGTETLEERRELLSEHRDAVRDEIEELRGCLDLLEGKIRFYRELERGEDPAGWLPEALASPGGSPKG